MSRFRRGWDLTRKSWALLRSHPQLIRFPLYGGAATVLCAVLVVGPGLYLIDGGEAGFGGPLVAIGFYLLAAIGTYFSVGLAAAADMVFQGRPASVAGGLAVSRRRLPQIASWAAVSTVVGMVLSALEDRTGVGGAILGRVLDVGWSLITFLAVPVIALEGSGPLATLRRSAAMFRARWGQQITGNVAIGGAVALLGVLPSALLVAGGLALWPASGFGGALFVVVGVIGLALALLVSSALSGIFGVALYRYALDGEAVGGFSAAELESAVRAKGGRGAPPTATPGTV